MHACTQTQHIHNTQKHTILMLWYTYMHACVWYLHVCMFVYTHTVIYMYIYIYIERERERDRYVMLFVSMVQQTAAQRGEHVNGRDSEDGVRQTHPVAKFWCHYLLRVVCVF